MPESSDPILPSPRLNIAGPASPRARVVRVEPCARATSPARFLHVEIDLAGSGLEGAFLPGQSFGVVMPPTEPGAKQLVRLYSVASPSHGEDGQGAVIAGTVRLVEGSIGAPSMLASLTPGQEIRITGPLGKNFLLPADPGAHEYVFVAAGTGVAPFRGMLMDLARRRDSRASLLVLAPTGDELLYDPLFRSLHADGGPIRYQASVGPDAHQAGFIDALDTLADTLRSERALVYICGPGGLGAATAAQLRTMGLDRAYFDAPESGGRPTRRCMVVSY